MIASRARVGLASSIAFAYNVHCSQGVHSLSSCFSSSTISSNPSTSTSSSPVMASFSLFSLNTFLMGAVNTSKASPPCPRKAERAASIGRFIQQQHFDVAQLQEVWGSNLEAFHTPLIANYQLGVDVSIYQCGGISKLAALVNTLGFWLQKTGGLYTAYQQKHILLRTQRHTFTKSETASKKGVQAVLLSLAHSSAHVLLLNTHLDPKNTLNRTLQLDEIKSFLCQFVKETGAAGVELDWQSCAVVLAGDLNIPKGSEEYHAMLTQLGKIYYFPDKMFLHVSCLDIYTLSVCRVLGARDLVAEASARKEVSDLEAANDDFVATRPPSTDAYTEPATYDFLQNSLAQVIYTSIYIILNRCSS